MSDFDRNNHSPQPRCSPHQSASPDSGSSAASLAAPSEPSSPASKSATSASSSIPSVSQSTSSESQSPSSASSSSSSAFVPAAASPPSPPPRPVQNPTVIPRRSARLRTVNPKYYESEAEVREAFRGKEKLEEEDMEELAYLKSVVKETLRDPQYWDYPESFIPKRFEKNSIDFMGNHFERLPFGGGRRICPERFVTFSTLALPL
nr:premnaspirodiene oxygenase-like [Ipomoea batatas]